MSSSRRTRQRRQQRSLQRHQLRLEGLEKRYALDGSSLSISMNADYVAAGTTFPTDYGSASLANISEPISFFLPQQNLVSFASVTDATPGMVITSLDLNGGQLWYSVNSGNTWFEITSASQNSGTVLIDDGNTRLHYEPPANYSSQLTDVFTFEAYDFASSMVSGTSQVVASAGSSSQPVGSYIIDHTMYEGTLGDGGKIKLFSDGIRAAAIHDDGLEILDISNPASIQRIGITPSESPTIEGLFSDVHIAGSETSVFINPTTPSTNGAFVVDLTNQSVPQLLSYNANTFAWTVTSNSDGSMVILGSTGGPEGQSFSNLHFFDTTNRASPQLLSSLNLTIPAATFGTPPFESTAESDLEVHGITISPDGNTLYVSCLSEMQHQFNVPLFFVVDISNVQQPQVIAQVSKVGFTSDLIFSPSHTLSLDGNTLYVAANEGTYNETGGGGFLAAYDVSNPTSPSQMWKRQFQYGGGFANEVVLDQSTGRIFVAYDGGVRSFAVNQFGVTDEALVSAAGMTNGVAVSADGKHAFVMEQDLLAVYAQNENFSVSVNIASAPNEPPADLFLSYTAVGENSQGATVGQLTTTDSDPGDIFTYSLVSGSGSTDNSLFYIEGDYLRVGTNLDYESSDTARIRIRTTDAQGQYFEKAFVIGVQNYNEPPTDISLSSTTVPEKQSVGTVVGTLTSTDPDGSNFNGFAESFTYSLANGTGDADNGSFEIIGDELRAKESFNYEVKDSYSVRIRTADNMGVTFEKHFLINISNVNDAPDGAVTIDGEPTQNVVLSVNTSTIQDEDGLGEFSYQWLRDGTPVSGANSSTHTLTQVDVGTQILVRVDYTDNEGTAESLTSAQTSAVVNVNDAPVLDSASSPQLRVVNEDAGVPVGPVGTLVLELIDALGTQNNFSDIDGDLPGIALTDTNLKGGTLWYTTDGGELWNNVGEVSDSAALLLYADSNTRLFFTPAVDFSGTINDVLEFRAWDRNGGHANGAKNIQTLSGDLAVVGSYAGNWGATTFSHDGNTLYFADQSRGLQAINVSRPEHPVLIGSSGTTGWSFHDLTLSPDGNTVYAANSANGLQVIDVSNPASPTIVGVVSTPHTATSVTLSPNGETAYVSNYYGGGIQVVDVSDPFNPSILGTIVTPHSAIESAISTDGNTLYVADYMSGLQIIDVRDPTSLSIVGSFSSEPASNTRYTDVTVSMDGNLLYIADNYNGLFIINVSNSTAPLLVGSISDIPNIDRFSANRITLAADGNSVFVTTANDDRPFSSGGNPFGEVQIIDVSDPMNPLWVSSLDTVSASSYSGPRSMELSNVGTTACVVQGPSLLLMDLGASAEFSVHTNLALVEVLPINNAPTLNQISDLVIPEDSLAQLVRLTGITAGGGETQPVKVTGTSSNPFLVLQPSVSSLEELDGLNRLLTVAPLPNQYGMATITVTVEDGGLDLDLDTTEDNATFSQTFDVTVTPDTDDPPSLVTPHGKMFIHETLSGDPLVSYQLPAVNVNGEAINGLLNRITVMSSDTALIPDPTVLYASADVPSSLSFTPATNANGTATLSIQVEDGGPDNDFATTEDNRQATHQVEVNVLEVISNQGSVILAKDSSESLYVNTQPVIYNQQQVPQAIFGSSVVGTDSSDSENALMLKPLGADAEDAPTHRLLTDEIWRINGIFNSLQNASSPVLDLSGREVSGTLNIAAVAGAYEINGVNNPTLVVRRGQTYTFNLNTAGHPFFLQTTGGGYHWPNTYADGFTGNNRTSGEYRWVVPQDAPDEIFYQCKFHPVMFGKIIVVD